MTIDKKTLDEAAVMQHEMFLSYVRAGFTEKQALKIIIAWIQRPSEGGADTT